MATKTESRVSNAKALAILASCDALDQYTDGQSYYLVCDGAEEQLWGYGEDEPCCENDTNTSWTSPSYPALPSLDSEGIEDEVADEIERMEAECSADLPELSDGTLKQRALRLITSGDAPVGADGLLAAAVLARW